ncbi:MAG TPA: TetR/AcrR family transcriptional regulator [Steroidobacteraceae bacterium]
MLRNMYNEKTEVFMKVSREQVAENRRKILDAAVRLLCERGFDAVTLGDVMKEAGLTHGGFYGYFQSKDDLLAQACAYAVVRDREVTVQPLQDYAVNYLSTNHRDNRAEGCPFSAIGTEAVRQSPEIRRKLTEGLRRYIDRFSETAAGSKPAQRRVDAIASFSAMLGGVILARIVDDGKLSDEVLSANRKTLAAAANGGGSPRAKRGSPR